MPMTEAQDENVYRAQREAMGLDRPLPVQYLDFFFSAIRFDFGESFTNKRPINEMLLERLPATVHLAIAGMFLAIVFGVP